MFKSNVLLHKYVFTAPHIIHSADLIIIVSLRFSKVAALPSRKIIQKIGIDENHRIPIYSLCKLLLGVWCTEDKKPGSVLNFAPGFGEGIVAAISIGYHILAIEPIRRRYSYVCSFVCCTICFVYCFVSSPFNSLLRLLII